MTRKTMRNIASHLVSRALSRRGLLVLAAMIAALTLTATSQPAHASSNPVEDNCSFLASYPGGGEADASAGCSMQITRFEITIEVTEDGHPVWNGPKWDCYWTSECVDSAHFGSQPGGHDWCTTAWYVFQYGAFVQDATDHNCILKNGSLLYSWSWQ